MTDREKAIVMAYTGIVMLKGDKFNVFHTYVEELFGREVYTHEFLSLHEQIKERSKDDFLKLCEEQEKEETETWNGIHAQVTAPKGTFERIFNNADDDYDI